MLTRFRSLQGYSLSSLDGGIGTLREFYFDDQTWNVRYLVVATGGWLSNRPVLIIPEVLREPDGHIETIPVCLTKEAIGSSPPIDFDKPVSQQSEEELHRHYQWQPYWTTLAEATWASVVTASVPRAAIRPISNKLPNPHLRSSAELANRYTVHATNGEIGRTYDFVVDDMRWEIRYLIVRTGLWFFGKDVLLSPDWIERISFSEQEVLVNLPRAAIKDAPALDLDEPISTSYEEQIHDHYQQRRYWRIPEAAGKIT